MKNTAIHPPLSYLYQFHPQLFSVGYLVRPSQDGHALSRQGHKGGPVSSAPVPGVVNVHQGITPGGSPQVLSVKALRNTKKKAIFFRETYLSLIHI